MSWWYSLFALSGKHCNLWTNDVILESFNIYMVSETQLIVWLCSLTLTICSWMLCRHRRETGWMTHFMKTVLVEHPMAFPGFTNKFTVISSITKTFDWSPQKRRYHYHQLLKYDSKEKIPVIIKDDIPIITSSSRESCSHHGSLGSIHSQEENDFVTGLLRPTGWGGRTCQSFWFDHKFWTCNFFSNLIHQKAGEKHYFLLL